MKLFNNFFKPEDWRGRFSETKLGTDHISAIFHGIGQVSSHTYNIDYDDMEKHSFFLSFDIQRLFPVDSVETFGQMRCASEVFGNTEYTCFIEKDGRTSKLKKLAASLLIEVDLNNKFNYNVSISDIIVYRERFRTDYNLFEYKEFTQTSLKTYDRFRLCGEGSFHQFREQLINYVKECVYNDFENELKSIDKQKEVYRTLNEFNSKIDIEYVKDIFGHVSDLCTSVDVGIASNGFSIYARFITPYVSRKIMVDVRSNQILSELIEATERTKSTVDCDIMINFEEGGFIVNISPKIEEYTYVRSGGTASYAYGTASVSYAEYIANNINRNDRIHYEI